MSDKQEPTIITLDNTNSIRILLQYIEYAQQKGAYMLNEAELLKRASDFLLNNVPDNELNTQSAKQLLIQGVHKGQRHGVYTLSDAALLQKVVQFVMSTTQDTSPQPQSQPQSQQEDTSSHVTSFDDLSELAEPIPLKPKEV
jgi:6-phosphogluconolactonase (cycloisomerase 2 family)